MEFIRVYSQQLSNLTRCTVLEVHPLLFYMAAFLSLKKIFPCRTVCVYVFIYQCAHTEMTSGVLTFLSGPNFNSFGHIFSEMELLDYMVAVFLILKGIPREHTRFQFLCSIVNAIILWFPTKAILGTAHFTVVLICFSNHWLNSSHLSTEVLSPFLHTVITALTTEL